MDRIRTIEELNCCLKKLEAYFGPTFNGLRSGSSETDVGVATVADTKVTATSTIQVTPLGDGSTLAAVAPLVVSAPSPGVGFFVFDPDGGNREFNYVIFY